MAPPRRSRLLPVLVLAAMASGVAPTAAPHPASQPERAKRVLAIFRYARDYPANVAIDRALQTAALSAPGGAFEYFAESLEMDRFPEPGQFDVMVDYMRRKYERHRIDVVVCMGSYPAEFFISHRDSIFPNAAFVTYGFEPVVRRGDAASRGVTGVVVLGAYQKTMNLALRLHPATERVFVVSGTPERDRRFETIVREELRALERPVAIEYLTDLPLGELIARLKQVPDRSLILYARQSQDEPAQVLLPRDILSLVSQAAPVPTYAIADSYRGLGAVGGYVVGADEFGRELARIVLSLVQGASADDIPVVTMSGTARFDWRQMQRWGIDPSRLPPETEILFRNPTIWESYRWYIVGTIAFVAIQTVMILSLVAQRARRRESEWRNSAILRAMPDMMFLLDRNGVYVDFNAPNQSELLVRPEQFLGRHMRDVLPPAVAAMFEEEFERLGDAPAVVEYALQMPEGDRHYEARMVPTNDDRILAVVRDITERKRAEAALHDAQAQLARVSRLTALGEFAASIAHEVRQPLTAIILNARSCLRRLAASEPDLLEVRAGLLDVVDAGRRAEEVIQRNRELFRHHTVQTAMLDINAVIRETVILATTRLRDSRVTLATSLGEDLPPIVGDRIELQQVLLNLIANAIDAMERVEQRTRRIELASSLAPDKTVQVTVRDNGIGFEGVDLERMYSLSYTTKASGTGVGLSISQSIVEAHGGRLWAEPNAGCGATFHFTIPVRSAAAAAETV